MTDSQGRLDDAPSDRHRIERELGAGGMATVYLAADLRHNRQVAVKVLRQDLAANLGTDRFLREIEIAAGLHHPHILPLYDSGRADDLLYFVMQVVDGESLRDRLARTGALPIAEAVRIIRGIADALAYSHRRGVVHRDIKPANILLSSGHALVADFGVAKGVSAASSMTELTGTGVTVGTPAYMAPEQATADPAIDHRADLYALGVTAYEILTGVHPFGVRAPHAMVGAHLTEAPAAVAARRPDAPPALAYLVMRLLSKDPLQRPQHAEDVLRAIDQVPSSDATGRGPSARRILEGAVPFSGAWRSERQAVRRLPSPGGREGSRVTEYSPCISLTRPTLRRRFRKRARAAPSHWIRR
jgi:serine/threonine-protein kinase